MKASTRGAQRQLQGGFELTGSGLRFDTGGKQGERTGAGLDFTAHEIERHRLTSIDHLFGRLGGVSRLVGQSRP